MRKRVKVLIFIVFLIQIIDACFTSIELHADVEEANFFMKEAISLVGTGWGFITYKIIIALLTCSALAYACQKRNLFHITCVLAAGGVVLLGVHAYILLIWLGVF